VAVAEESGRLPESLKYLSEEYDDETRRRMALVTKILGVVIWMGVAVLIAFCVFQIFQKAYMGRFDRVGGT
jgi:type II secretory pathway component PulF